MNEFIVMSPNYELLRYGSDKIQKQVNDAHSMGKKVRFVITKWDLIDSDKPPVLSNFRFELCQYEAADVVVYVRDGKSQILKEIVV